MPFPHIVFNLRICFMGKNHMFLLMCKYRTKQFNKNRIQEYSYWYMYNYFVAFILKYDYIVIIITDVATRCVKET